MANSRFDRFLQRIADRFDRFDLGLQNKLLDVFPRLREFVFPNLPLESGVGLLTPGAIGTGQFSTDVDAIAEFASNSQINIAEELDSLGGIEGSAAIFETGGSGFHALTLTIASEDPLGQDAIAFFNGEQLFELDASAIEGTFNTATGKYEATVTVSINSAGDELAGIVLDREDAAGDTTVTFNSIEALGEDAVLDPLLSVVEVEVAIDNADPILGEGLLFTEGFNDGIGAFADGIISTGEGAVSLSELDANFFRTALGEGVEGSGALLVTEPGLNRLVLNITTEQEPGVDGILLFDGRNFLEVDERAIANALEFDAATGCYEGQLTVDLYTNSDEFGAAVVDRGDAFGATTLEVESATFFAEGTADDQSDFLAAVVIPEADPLLGTFENPIQLEEGQTFSGELDFGESVFFREPSLSEVGIEGRIDIGGDLFVEEVSALGGAEK